MGWCGLGGAGPSGRATAPDTSGRCRRVGSAPASRSAPRPCASSRRKTAVHSVAIIAEAPDWLSYDLPTELLGVALKGRYCGQRQKWFAMRFLGEESEIDISPRNGHKAEFEAWRWTKMTELPDLIIPFKRQVYRDLVSIFAPYAA